MRYLALSTLVGGRHLRVPRFAEGHRSSPASAARRAFAKCSTLSEVDTCEYPDSQKVSIVTGQRGEKGLRKMFRAENTVDYYDREPF